MITATSTDTHISEPSASDSRRAQPIYLGYEALRAAVRSDAPRAITAIGRLYLYGDFVFLNSLNEGVHVIDNRDPENPVNLAFLVIPGNTELEIRDDYLYADSYVDLVTLDLDNPSQIGEVARQEGIFAWDACQNVPDDVYFFDSDLDETCGVVIGHAL